MLEEVEERGTPVEGEENSEEQESERDRRQGIPMTLHALNKWN